MKIEYRHIALCFGFLMFAAVVFFKASFVRGEEIPEWTQPDSVASENFQLGGDSAAAFVWGRGRELPRYYPDEFLPALFERTLVLEKTDLGDGRLEWIFTGPRGGITISIGASAVELRQRYYDSYGYNAVNGKVGRHPEWSEKPVTIPYQGKLQAVTVRMEHTLELVVELNGREMIRRLAPLDVTRHQLWLTGKKGDTRGRLLRPAAEKTDVSVNPKDRRQTMIGFGGIATPTAYAQLSPEGKKRWWELLAEYNLLIQREYPIGTSLHQNMDNWDRLEDATPHYYGDNFPNGEICDFEYLKQIRKIGGQVWFEFWALPRWMCTESHAAGKQGVPKRRKVDIQAYVRGMLGYCRACKKHTGAPPEVLGIQNEVVQPPEVWHAMTTALRRGLDQAGFQEVRIHMADSAHLQGGIKAAEAFRRDKQAWQTIDYAAAHMYDYQGFFNKPDAYDPLLKRWKQMIGDKPFLSTEICINSGRFQWPGYRLALSMGQLYHKNLTLADASAICYCWTLLNVVQPSYGWSRSLFVPDRSNGFMPAASSHQLRVFGAYSRRVPRGMTRVEAHSSCPDLLVSAFTGKDDAGTIVLMNRSTRPVQVSLNAKDMKFTQQELVNSYSPNKITKAPVPDAAGMMQLKIKPGSIITLTNVPLGKLPEGM